MPISDKRGNTRKPFLADYYGKDGGRRQILCKDRIEAEIEMLTNAGSKSRHDMRFEISVTALFEFIWRIKDGQGQRYVFMESGPITVQVLDRIGSKNVSDVLKTDFAIILAHLRTQLSPFSLGRRCSVIEAAFDVAVHLGCCERNLAREAFREVSRRRTRRNPAVPVKSDTAKIEDAAVGWVLIQFLLYTEAGLTSSEAAALPWGAVDFTTGVLQVRVIARERGSLSLDRLRKSRSVQASDKLLAALAAWERNAERDATLVIGDGLGRIRSRYDLLQPLNRLQIGLGITKVPVRGKRIPAWKVHGGLLPRYDHLQFRLCAAMRWKGEGASPKIIARRLGLKSSKTILRLFDAAPDPEDLGVMASFDRSIGSMLTHRVEASRLGSAAS